METVATLMGEEKADMVFTDPPYALIGNSTGVSGVGDDKMIMPFFREIGAVLRSVVKPMGHIYVCHDWQTSATIKAAFQDLTAKNLIVWRKADAGGLGSFYTKIYELIWLFANELEKGIIGKAYDGLVVLGNGEITKKVTVKAARFSKVAAEKIATAGGKAEVI